jgi:exosortase
VNGLVVRERVGDGVVAEPQAENGAAVREKVADGPALRVAHRLPWLALAVAVAAALGLYAPLVVGMAAEWAEFPNLSHGFAVPLISAYLVWRQRHVLTEAPLEGSMAGLPVIAVGLAMLVIGSLGGESFVARLSLPLVLLGTIIFLAGTRVVRHTWLAIAYLFFMIPLPYVTLKMLTYESRLFDAGLTAVALGWLGVPVLRDGVLLHLPNMTLEVADECSSIPAMAALVALGAAYAQMQPRPAWSRVALTLAAAPLGLLSNLVRLILTSLSAYYFGPIALNNVIHKFNGTSVFLATVLLLVALDTLLTHVWRRARP